jgi:glycosyltransferase involved in cell wall biosynthesis
MNGKGDERWRSTQVIIAALNEEPGIGPTISELKQNLNAPKILVVDGKSRDRTVEIARSYGADIVYQDRMGKGNAISNALEQADLSLDFVVFIDADSTYPARHIPEMIKILEENPSVGMVCGNRFTGNLEVKATMNDLFYFGNRILAFVHNMLNGVALRDPLTGLRVVRSEILRDWVVKSMGFDFEVELNHQVERKGFTIMEVPIEYRPRLGEKKLKMRHGATILRRIVLETVQ